MEDKLDMMYLLARVYKRRIKDYDRKMRMFECEIKSLRHTIDRLNEELKKQKRNSL